MTDTSLRDALEKIAENEAGDSPASFAQQALMDHPAEPLEVCSACGHIHTADGCVGEQTPSDRWAGVSPSVCDCDAEPVGVSDEAAAPLMGATPVASRQAVARPLHDAMHGRLACTGSPNCYIWDEAYKAADALLAAGVFREPPTREQIAEALHREKHSEACLFTNRTNCGEWHAAVREADAVLALMGGAETPAGE